MNWCRVKVLEAISSSKGISFPRDLSAPYETELGTLYLKICENSKNSWSLQNLFWNCLMSSLSGFPPICTCWFQGIGIIWISRVVLQVIWHVTEAALCFITKERIIFKWFYSEPHYRREEKRKKIQVLWIIRCAHYKSSFFIFYLAFTSYQSYLKCSLLLHTYFYVIVTALSIARKKTVKKDCECCDVINVNSFKNDICWNQPVVTHILQNTKSSNALG